MIIQGIKLFEKQEEIIKTILNTKTRYVSLVASRQFSKSTIMENILMYRSLNQSKTKCLYITPTFSLSRILMEKLYQNLVESKIIKSYNKTENIITFINGSEIHFRSGTNPNNIRGLSIHYSFIDEAAFMTDDVWQVTRPTMSVIGKQCIIASTPRGKHGFFFHTCQLGKSGTNDNYMCLYGHYSQNPFYNKEDVEQAKSILPENVFRQEYEAEFLDDGGSVFQNVKSCQTIHKFNRNINEGPYSIGIDLGRQSDFTVATVLNKDNEVVDVYRINQRDWSLIIRDLASFLRKYPGSTILCETNSIGDVVYDLLRKSVPDILPFVTTNVSKSEIIEELIYAIQTKNIKLPIKELYPELSQELETFTFQYSKSTRRIIYSALQGFHDDCVISLALAYKAKKKRGVGGFAFV